MNRKSQITHQERKKELLVKCFELMAEKGLENTGMRDLCRACELSTNNSLYHYFGKKDTIVVEAVVAGLERIEKAFFESAVDETVDLSDFLHGMPALMEKYQDGIALIYQVAVSPRYRDDIAPYIQLLPEHYDEYTLLLAKKLGCSADALKPLVYLLVAVNTKYMLFRDDVSHKVQISYIIDQINAVSQNKIDF